MYNKKRHTVRPGITGLAQIKGRTTLTHKEKLKYDDIYIDNISFKLDIEIFFKTIIYILKQIFF